MTSSQLEQLIPFLKHDNPVVRQKTTEYIFQLTSSEETEKTLVDSSSFFLHLLPLINDPDMKTRKNVLSTMINILGYPHVAAVMSKKGTLDRVVQNIIDGRTLKSYPLIELDCMLLSNITKNTDACYRILGQKPQFGVVEKSSSSSLAPIEDEHSEKNLFFRPTASQANHFIHLVWSVLGALNQYKKNGADPATGKPHYLKFKWLLHVFSNVARIPPGRNFLVYGPFNPTDKSLRRSTQLNILSPVFFHDFDPIVRGGVISLFKNLCFDPHLYPYLFDIKNQDYRLVQKLNWFESLLTKIRAPPIPTSAQLEAGKGVPITAISDVFYKTMVEFNSKFEIIPELRTRIAEGIAAIASSFYGRRILEKYKVYQILKEIEPRELDKPAQTAMISAIEVIINNFSGDEKQIAQDDKSLPPLDETATTREQIVDNSEKTLNNLVESYSKQSVGGLWELNENGSLTESQKALVSQHAEKTVPLFDIRLGKPANHIETNLPVTSTLSTVPSKYLDSALEMLENQKISSTLEESNQVPQEQVVSNPISPKPMADSFLLPDTDIEDDEMNTASAQIASLFE